MDIAELFGYTGMVVGTLVFVPQVYKTYHTKSVEDISWGMLVLLVLNCVSWFSTDTYGTHCHSYLPTA